MKKSRSLLLLIVIIASGCTSFKKLTPPEYRDVGNFQIVELGLLESKASADVLLFNPNKLSASIIAAQGDLFADSIYIGKISLASPISIKKKTDFTVPVILTLDNISALANQKKLLKKKEIMFMVKGAATVRKAGITKEIPLDFQQVEEVEKIKSIFSKSN